MQKVKTYSPNETKKFAKSLAKKLLIKGGVVALIGELGAGKTTFAQGLAKGLGIREKIISPTFVLIREHKIPKSNSIFYHLDLYRLENNDFNSLGLSEILNSQNIILVEWAQKVVNILPKDTVKITLEKISDNSRKITVH